MPWTNWLKHFLRTKIFVSFAFECPSNIAAQKMAKLGVQKECHQYFLSIYHVQSRQHCVVEKGIIFEFDRPVNPGSILS